MGGRILRELVIEFTFTPVVNVVVPPTEGLLWMNVEHVEDVLHVNRNDRQKDLRSLATRFGLYFIRDRQC